MRRDSPRLAVPQTMKRTPRLARSASRGLSRRIAGQTADPDAVLKEMEANLIPSARLVAAGVVGVTHAQEYGFSLLFVG